MTKAITTALKSKAASTLIANGFKITSTQRQLANGTIALQKRVGRKTARYAVTATGAVLGNEFVARQVFGESEAQQYRLGLEAVAELAAKRSLV